MHITLFTDYALRVLMYLALNPTQQVTIREIADSYGISKNHLMKVVQDLNNKGYLKATRGKNGGLRLRGEPEGINLGTLVRTTEQDLTLVECFGSDGQCVITPACQLKRVLAEALETFFHTLDGYTLADLLPSGNITTMRDLLQIQPERYP